MADVFSIVPFPECYSSNVPHFFEGVWTDNKNMVVLKIYLWNVLFGMKQTPKTSSKIVWVECSSCFEGIIWHTTEKQKKHTHTTHTEFPRWWFQTFFFFTLTWGNDPIWRAYFSMGLVQPPTSTVPIWLSRCYWIRASNSFRSSYRIPKTHWGWRWVELRWVQLAELGISGLFRW